jgi:glycosyltransferase involved in cell wall biosynthesis
MSSVDVVVPCYEYGRFLRESVTSVLQQGIPDVRVLIIDNASTDNTLEVARELAAQDRRVEVVSRQTNLGHLASFNEGIDWARADYFMVLCADDLLAPGCFHRAISVMEEYPRVNLTFGRELIITPDTSDPSINPLDLSSGWRVMDGAVVLKRLCGTGRPDASRFMIAGTTALVRTSAQKRVGHYRSHLPHTADLEIWLRFACLGAAAETDAIQGIRRVHPLNRSASLYDVHMWDLHWEAAFESFFRNEGALLPDAKDLRRMARHSLGERAYWGFVSNLLRGDFPLSFNLLKFAFARCPTTMVVPPVGYLFRHGDSLSRISKLISELAGRWRAPVSENSDGL